MSRLALIMPGLLVAATGVGAGDLATASLAGSHLGCAVLWAVIVGGAMKFMLTEGLARWQLVTGETLLEGVARRAGPAVGIVFLPYLMLWSFFVGSALMSACGVTLHAMVPLFENANHGKVAFGVVSSVVGLLLVMTGGFKLFEKVMGVSIAVMFAIVVTTALLLWPGTSVVLSGLFVPTIPDPQGIGVTWTVALIGGVGGTLTILCYGYWIREQGRSGRDAIRVCRIDLATGYGMTVLFGVAMVIVGSTVEVEGRGAGLLVALADRLTESLGTVGRWLFLVGAFGAVFSSLLGVWQSVPYLFADVWSLFVARHGETYDHSITASTPYRVFGVCIAVVPMTGLFLSFNEVQKLYAVVGSLFVPLLAATLLVLNGRRAWLGGAVNHPLTSLGLAATLLFFAGLAWMKWAG